ncbi:hypothetical protein HGRIS_014728 [Hohenbuehelia grisea]|uniref:DUF7330 domain-containing protein n=1 Tax=Hohenbuehelia grisea TaxID=104357 RepID=A0ABR3IQJ4_9AGAR
MSSTHTASLTSLPLRTPFVGAIDHRFIIGASPDIESDQLDKQLTLRVDVDNGPLKAEVHLAGKDNVQQPSRARLRLGSKNGPVTVKVTAAHNFPERRPFTLAAYTCNGPIAVLLPRDFRGPLHLTTFWGSGRLSDAVSQAVSLFGDSGNGATRTYFVGNCEDYMAGGAAAWAGDEALAATSSGSVAVLYSDEGSVKDDFTLSPGIQPPW